MKNNNLINRILFIIFLFYTPLLFSQNLLLFDDDYEKESNSYITRVNSDGGNVGDKGYLNKFIKNTKSNGILESILFWTSSQWGIKVDQDKVTKQYELKGKDLTSQGLNNSPFYKFNDLFEKNGIYYSGEKVYSENSELVAEHPLTIVIVLHQTEGMNKEALLDTKEKKEHSIYFDDGPAVIEPLIIETSGKSTIGKISNIKSLLYLECNGDESKVYYNGSLLFSGKIGKGNLTGIRVGALKNLQKGYFLNGYIFELGIIGGIPNDDQRIKLMEFLKQHYIIN